MCLNTGEIESHETIGRIGPLRERFLSRPTMEKVCVPIIGWMSDLAAFIAGIVTGMVANGGTALWTRFRAYRAAEKLVGKWVTYEKDDRAFEKLIDGALTEILARPWWSRCSTDSHVLPVRSTDPSGREHSGYFAIDPSCPWRATRTILYHDSDEIAGQRVEISPSGNTLYVFPDPPNQGYEQHALRRCD